MRARSLGMMAALVAAAISSLGCGSSAAPGPDASAGGPGLDASSTVAVDGSAAGLDAASTAGRDASSAGFDATAGAGLDASVAGLDASATPCCVVFTIGDAGSQTFCQGPALTGAAAATPTIGMVATPPYGTQVQLHSGLAQAVKQSDALYVTIFQRGNDAGVMQAGTVPTPQIEYYGPTGGWWENNASNGSITVDSWTAVGAQVTGTFNGQIADMSGPGGYPEIHGTFCAVRAADK
jgi:hypothetical protein